MSTLADRVLAIHAALNDADLPHAFGGALALAFHVEEPRATRDIDLNIFVPTDRVREAFTALPAGVVWTDDDVAETSERGQIRLFWDDTPVDIFFSTHAFHDVAALGIVDVPFEDTTLPVLGATALAVFKAFFDRTRDWADIEAMLEVGTIDVPQVLGWLVALVGERDERVLRLRDLWERERGDDGPRFAPGPG
jgi:hypothetical protein